MVGCQVKVKTGPDSKTDELIDIRSIRANLEFLSSDELEGREAGSKGEKVASQFIASELKKYGVNTFRHHDDYFQHIDLRVIRFSDQSKFSTVDDNGQIVFDYKPSVDFVGSTRYHPKIDTTANMVFAGYGVIAEEYNYNDYADLDVEGKIVLIYPGEPESDDSTYFKGKKRTKFASFYKKIDTATDQGALAVIGLARKDTTNRWDSMVRYVKKGKFKLKDQKVIRKTNSVPHIIINEQTFTDLLNESPYSIEDLKKSIEDSESLPKFELQNAIHINWMFDTTGTASARNVIGIIEGNDPEFKHEFVGIGAHFDHVGIGPKGVYNGADDNASGTVALLEIAKAFAKTRDNKRTILITFHTAEEKGLLGSKYIVKDSIITKHMNVHINMDMIGRGSADSIYCLGSDKLSKELYELVEEVNLDGVGIHLDYTLNDPNDPQRLYYRSDHYSYAKMNIPSVFFFDYQMDDYHKVTDDMDKINFSKVQKIARLVYEIALESANRESKFRLD
jgi:Zn-dependent M28 family amino/carboxypeptidase